MFILLAGVGVKVRDTIKLLETILNKLGKVKSQNNKHHDFKLCQGAKETKNDEFLPAEDEKNLRMSVKELILILISMLSGDGDSKEFDNYLKSLKDDLKKTVYGNFTCNLNDNSFVSYLQDCLGNILSYCNEKKDSSGCKKSWEEARNAIGNIQALDPITALAKLLNIAKNSNYPQEIRLLAASLVNDALSHMKGQHFANDNKTAKALVSLIGNSPDDIRGVVFYALEDAKKIEKNTNRENPDFDPDPAYVNVHGFLRKTLASA